MDVPQTLAAIQALQREEIERLEVLTDRVETLTASVAELMAWLQQPPSSDLADALRQLAEAAQVQADRTEAIERALAQLPANVARAVSTGEVA